MFAIPAQQDFEPQPPGHGLITCLADTPDGMFVKRAAHGLEQRGAYLLRPDAMDWEQVTVH